MKKNKEIKIRSLTGIKTTDSKFVEQLNLKKSLNLFECFALWLCSFILLCKNPHDSRLCLNKSLLNSKLRDDCFLRPPKQKINDAVHGV